MRIGHKNGFCNLMPIFYFFLLGSVSCLITHSAIRSDPKEGHETLSPRIIFLNYAIRLDKSGGEPEIRLISKSVAEGNLKTNRSLPEIAKPGDLTCIAMDDHLQAVESIIIPDPLNITVESVSDNNALFKKEIALDSAQFSVRMQLNEKINAIGIKKNTGSESQNSFLLITKIK
jgi:hypothetical protein